MKSHPFLRAYMAGVLLPTWFLLIVLASLSISHFTVHTAAGLERAIIFPMAVVPNVWGVWNVIYLGLRLHHRISIGMFGAFLPVLLVPAGVVLVSVMGLEFYSVRQAAFVLPVVMAIYYLLWKYGVNFLNRIVELRGSGE